MYRGMRMLMLVVVSKLPSRRTHHYHHHHHHHQHQEILIFNRRHSECRIHTLKNLCSTFWLPLFWLTKQRSGLGMRHIMRYRIIIMNNRDTWKAIYQKLRCEYAETVVSLSHSELALSNKNADNCKSGSETWFATSEK